MTDLIERLRLVPRTVSTAGKDGIHCAVGEWCHEAAAAIAERDRQIANERANKAVLEKWLEQMTAQADRFSDQWESAEARVAVLEAALRHALIEFVIIDKTKLLPIAQDATTDGMRIIGAALAAPAAPRVVLEPGTYTLPATVEISNVTVDYGEFHSAAPREEGS